MGGFLRRVANAAASVVGAVGDLLESVVDTVTEIVEEIIETVVEAVQTGAEAATDVLCRIGNDVVCLIGSVIFGALSGIVALFGDLLLLINKIASSLGRAVGAVFRGDFAGVLRNLGLAGIAFFELASVGVRGLSQGYTVGGAVGTMRRQRLRRFVEELIAAHYADRPEAIEEVRRRLRLDSPHWGFPLDGIHMVFRLDSATTSLWEWHQDGVMDLYAMAGLFSTDSFNPGRSRHSVWFVNDEGRERLINRFLLSEYINSNGERGRIRVYALTSDAVKDFTRVTTRKLRQLGIRLRWHDAEEPRFTNRLTANRTTVHDISTRGEFLFSRPELSDYLTANQLRSLVPVENDIPTTHMDPAEQCTMLALAAFRFSEEDGVESDGLGSCAGRRLREGDESQPCTVTPDRDDGCCAVIQHDRASGTIYRDQLPPIVFRYVLAHEAGHYVGLCHHGHDGVHNIMYSHPNHRETILDFIRETLAWYYMHGEPGFSPADARNAWRFLLAQMGHCVEGGIDAMRTRQP